MKTSQDDPRDADESLKELLIAIVDASGPIDREELTRCASWCADAEDAAVFARLVRTKRIRIHWPEGATEPTFSPATVGKTGKPDA